MATQPQVYAIGTYAIGICAFCTRPLCLLPSTFSLFPFPFYLLSSTIVENTLQIGPFNAKQTQFQNR